MGDAPGAWVAAATARLPDKNAPILCFCAVGGRSRRAAEALRGAGYTNVKNAGGFLSVGDTRSGARYV
jgi:rhodanese-related sulfurtransferase